MSINVKAAVILGVVALAGCGGAMSERQCRKGDWYEKGTRDGAHGKAPATLATYARACAEFRIRPDAQAWQAGHREGLARYCTEAHGYDAGKNGSTYQNACAERPREEAAFFSGYGRGLLDRVEELRSDLRRLSEQTSF